MTTFLPGYDFLVLWQVFWAQIEESFKLKKLNLKKKKENQSLFQKANEDHGNCPIALCGHWNRLLYKEFRNYHYDSGAYEQP